MGVCDQEQRVMERLPQHAAGHVEAGGTGVARELCCGMWGLEVGVEGLGFGVNGLGLGFEG